MDDLTYYRSALAGQSPPMHDGQPHAGYYRMRTIKNGPWLPVVIFTRDGVLTALVGQQRSIRDPAEIWTWCGDKPVPKAIAMTAFDTGEWPGDAVEAKSPAIGDNSAKLSLSDQIKDYAATALAWLKRCGVTDTVTKDTAANMRAKLLELRKQADAERETEKRPHLEASRAIDAKYKPMIETADAAVNALRDHLTQYMQAEERKLREEQEAKRKAEEARIAAERRRIEAERAEQMRSDPIAALTSPEPEMPELPPHEEPVKVQAGGQRGRKTGLRTVTRYIVTDYEAALTHCKDHPQVRAAIEKVCCAQARAGAPVPGVKKVEEKVAA